MARTTVLENPPANANSNQTKKPLIAQGLLFKSGFAYGSLS
jgi:hypothetical protein